MRQALSWSSNIGMVTLEQRMTDRWQQYLQQFDLVAVRTRVCQMRILGSCRKIIRSVKQ